MAPKVLEVRLLSRGTLGSSENGPRRTYPRCDRQPYNPLKSAYLDIMVTPSSSTIMPESTRSSRAWRLDPLECGASPTEVDAGPTRRTASVRDATRSADATVAARQKVAWFHQLWQGSRV